MKGILNILKPSGITSSDVVVRIRGLIRSKYGIKEKVGHFGTLDPQAAGVLTVAIGNANRLFAKELNKIKEYRAGFTFGIATDTLDSYGEIIQRSDCDVSLEQFISATDALVGSRYQMPPQYSSKKVGGVPSYRIARQGGTVELKPKQIEVFEIKNRKKTGKNSFLADITCSSGTYIRSIAGEAADIIGKPCYMDSLVRLMNGKCRIDDAQPFEVIEGDFEGQLIPLEQYLEEYNRLRLGGEYAKALINGQPLNLQTAAGEYLVFLEDDLFGLMTVDEEGKARVEVRFYDS